MAGASEDVAVRPRVALLFTRYPVATETFLQREVEILRRQPGRWEVCALWPLIGSPSAIQPDDQMRIPELLLLFWWIPYWLLRKPRAMRRIAASLLEARAPNAINFLENLLGLGYGILRARKMAARHTHLHAVWASAPAAAAWALHQLTGIPYSLAGHAYDLYEHGGDGWLPLKLESARMVRTSTLDGQRRWIRLGAEPGMVRVIRRGLPEMPPFDPDWRPAVPFRILSVGRMVEKMGIFQLLEILSRLHQTGFSFEATLIGDGPLAPRIRERCIALGLEDPVRFTGALPYSEVEDWYRWADAFLFAGRIARSGDRAGFPNAIGEAMAWGLPVVAAPVGAVVEGVRHRETGLLFREPDEAVRQLRLLGSDPEEGRRLRLKARLWVEDAFDARRNVATLVREILKAHPQTRS